MNFFIDLIIFYMLMLKIAQLSQFVVLKYMYKYFLNIMKNCMWSCRICIKFEETFKLSGNYFPSFDLIFLITCMCDKRTLLILSIAGRSD